MSNINVQYTQLHIIQIMTDVIGLYLIIKKDSENRAKLTVKTILMSLFKNDLNVFYKYYDMFRTTLFKIKKDKILNDKEINIREVAFSLLMQIKLIVDSYYNMDNYNNDVTLNEIIKKRFSDLNNKNFYLFKVDDNDNKNNFLTNIDQIESKTEFAKTIKNIMSNSAKKVLDENF